MSIKYTQEESMAYRQLDRLGAQIWADIAYTYGRISKERWEAIFSELSSSEWSASGYSHTVRNEIKSLEKRE